MALSFFHIDRLLPFQRQPLPDLQVQLTHQPQARPIHPQAYQLGQMERPLQHRLKVAQDLARLRLCSFQTLDLIPTLNCAVVAFVERLQMQHHPHLQMVLLLTALGQRLLVHMFHQTLRQAQAAATAGKCL
jgi:hypothetical protein